MSVRHPGGYGQHQWGKGFEAPEKGWAGGCGGVSCAVSEDMDPGDSGLTKTQVFVNTCPG